MQGNQATPPALLGILLREPCSELTQTPAMRWGMGCQRWDRAIRLQRQELKAQRDLQRPGKPGKHSRGFLLGSAEEGYQLLEQKQEADLVIQSYNSLGIR